MTPGIVAFIACLAVAACVIAVLASSWSSVALDDARKAERWAEHLADLLVTDGWTREALDAHERAWSRQQEQAKGTIGGNRWP